MTVPELSRSIHVFRSDEIIADVLACVAAGAAEIHVHPRSETGTESLWAVDTTVNAIRRVCPGTLIGVSTGGWIEGCTENTKSAIFAWKLKPDYASVNLSETDSAEIVNLLCERHIAAISDIPYQGKYLFV
ncbi:3-keto-5-aminohexanoate cleavage protein [Rahnella sp. CG8]|jgi:uncharacterized protein (DUF849 family)|uniref:3-keto-5-aminohexanoate cleavage protein n=1 Tax=Rahnella sp. CG8 TaxID=2726078 RepID=UPI00333D4F91